MLFSVHHRTTYRYAGTVSLSYHAAHLRPLDLAHQTCRGHRLQIEPLPASLEEERDYFGNGVTTFTIARGHNRLVVDSVSEVEMLERPDDPMIGGASWEAIVAEAAHPADDPGLAAAEFTFASPAAEPSREVADYAALSFTPDRSLRDCALDLCGRIYRDFTFDSTATTISTPPAEVLKLGRGVCQDFAHLMIAGCRALGVPARYVSGYLETAPPRGAARMIGADASHAWVSIHAGGGVWLDFDPTNDRMAGLGHITVALGRDYRDISPLRGVILGGGRHSVDVGVDVERRLI
jgi:transglutaminase-like putative cysteine protease